MNKKIIQTMTLISLLSSGAVVNAASSNTAFTSEQQKQMQQIIHDYLVQHPEVLIEASQVLQKKQQEAMEDQAQTAIKTESTQLFHANSSMAGNIKGDVTLVEFFDYQCSHCIKMKPVLSHLIEKNKNLRVIYREFPIFGKNSEFASKMALAAAKQNKYVDFQNALLSLDKPITEALVLDTAKSLGLNVDQLKKDSASADVESELKHNRELAEKMRLMGTPAFVIAYTPNGEFDAKVKPVFVPGGASEESLQAMINQVTQK